MAQNKKPESVAEIRELLRSIFASTPDVAMDADDLDALVQVLAGTADQATWARAERLLAADRDWAEAFALVAELDARTG
jgi:hypothetical protein